MDKVLDFLRVTFLRLNLMSSKCFDEIFVKLNFGARECLLDFLSKGLGLGIVAGSLLVKFPQIIKLIGAGSAVGLSLTGIGLELLAVTANGAYSYAHKFPFSAYGEAIFLSLQTALIAFLVLRYNKGWISALLFAVVYSAVTFAVLQPQFPKRFLWYGQAANIPMIVVGKLIQVFSNFRNGHTGQLSAVTTFMLAAGSLARIFTSIRETGDSMVILTYVAGSICSSLIAFQMIYYWNATNQFLKQQKSKKKL